MISMTCEAAAKAATAIQDDRNSPGKIQAAHARCQGAPGRGAFVCDCICHKPQGKVD